MSEMLEGGKFTMQVRVSVFPDGVEVFLQEDVPESGQ